MPIHTRIVKADQDRPDPDAVHSGAEVILSGGTVIFPTETVYGLGANGMDQEACLKIFTAKNRPPDNPLILHISSIEMLDGIAVIRDKDLRSRLARFWPGPLTVLLAKADAVPDAVSAGQPTVAVRMPDNRLALELISASGVPIAAPSANLSTKPSITDSQHAIQEMSGRVDLIYDSGKTSFGLESTILDVTTSPPRLLRAGSATVESLQEVFGKIEISEEARGTVESDVAITPGMKYRHYAPEKPFFLMKSVEEFRRLNNLDTHDLGILAMGSDEVCCSDQCLRLGSMNDLRQIGHNLFSAFRQLDQSHFKMAVIHPFPEYGYGLAIMNRIRKATGHRVATMEEILKMSEDLKKS
ncbi:MAG: L-threonylcarbamoyladenylate synthase [Thermoplasmataceae archaeon]